MLEARSLEIPEVLELTPRRFGDPRGFFSETYRRDRFVAAGVAADWMQDNQSFSAEVLTLRGLHYQDPPFAQAKLVRVLRGRILDVAVDIRKGSPTYRHWVSLEISAERFNQIFVPVGFAHGLVTLEPDTEVFYKVSAPYSPAHDRTIRFDDPEIGVAWPLGGRMPILSEKDAKAPNFAAIDNPFVYPDTGTTSTT